MRSPCRQFGKSPWTLSSSWRWIFAWSLLLLLLPVSSIMAATGVKLQWDANSEPGVAGYKLYYGTTSGTYTHVFDAGHSTTANVPDVVAGLTYYFAVTAYDADGYESVPSSEVSATAPWPSALAATPLPWPADQQRLPQGLKAGISLTPATGRFFSLDVFGPEQSAVTVYATVDFRSWDVLGTVPNPTGFLKIEDVDTPKYDRRYYRFRQVELPATGPP